MRKSILIALLSTVAIPAIAADMPVKAAPREAPIYNSWTGFYIGGHGGYGWGRDPFFEGFQDPLFRIGGIDSKGAVFGGQFGHNWQWGSWVGGLEIDVSGTDIKGSEARTHVVTAGNISDTVTRTRDDKFAMLGSSRGRLGFLITPSLWLYGTGGLAWTQFKQGERVSETVVVGTQSETVSFSQETTDWRFGFAVGGGAEFMLSEHLLLRGEFLHYDFGNAQASFSQSLTCVNIPGCANQTISNTTGRLTTNVARGALSWKF